MNTARHTTVDLDELARMLPAPPAPALDADRHAFLRRQLLDEIADAAAVRRSRRKAVTGLAVGAAGVTVIAAVAGFAVFGVPGQHGSPDSAQPGAVPATVVLRPATTVGLAAFSRHISHAAQNAPAVTVGPDQYVYVKSLVAFTRPDQQQSLGGAATLDPLHEREIWLSQDPTKTPGLIREYGKDETLYGADGDPTYASLSALPTDPAALRQEIYTETAGRAPNRDGAAFDQIGQLIDESIVPAQQSAALYRVAASLPGVELVPDAVDAAGRHGTALARTDNGERTELIFDTSTYAYLGERSYLVRRTPMGPAGMLTGSTAILDRGVADSAGEVPATPTS